MQFTIMASGLSMCREDANLVNRWRGDGRKAIAINNTFELAPWADIIYACDARWWDKRIEEVRQVCTGELWAYEENKHGIKRAELKKTGGNSGYQAARLAITEFGASRLILLGYDMQGSHWHEDHGEGFHNPNENHFKQWIGWMCLLAREFPEVEIINASRQTAIECLPRLSLEAALQ